MDNEKAKLAGGNTFTGDQVIDGTISSKKVVQSGTSPSVTSTITETAITDSSIAMTKQVLKPIGSGGIYGTTTTLFNVDSSGNTTIAGNLVAGSGSATGTNSVALGYKTKSGSWTDTTDPFNPVNYSGDYTSAMGYLSIAAADYATAMGFSTKAIAEASTAMGILTTASGDYSTAMGVRATASGDASTAMGVLTTASGDVAVAIGESTTASAEAATAMGYETTASGFASTATGLGSIAKGNGSFAGGGYLDSSTSTTVAGGTAYGQSSFAFGTGALAGKIVSGSGTTQDPYVYGGDNAVAMGANSIASGENALAMMGGTASALNSIAIGSGNVVSGVNSVALGTGLTVSGAHSGAFGDPSSVSGASSYSIGNNNTVQGDNVFVLGNNVNVGADINNAVILGNNSTAVDGAVSVGSADNYRRISNVADGINAHDVTTVGQMNASLANLENRTNRRIDRLENKVDKGFASTAALASLKPLSNAHKTQISAAVGGYGSNQALAVGGFHYLNDYTLLSVGGSYGGDSNISYGVGITFGF